MDAVESTVRRCLARPDPAACWAALCAAAVDADDLQAESVDIWLEALPLLVGAGRYGLADRVMVERIRPDPFFSAQPDLMYQHALALQGLGRTTAALRAVRSALQDMPWDASYQALAAALAPQADIG